MLRQFAIMEWRSLGDSEILDFRLQISDSGAQKSVARNAFNFNLQSEIINDTCSGAKKVSDIFTVKAIEFDLVGRTKFSA